MTKKTWFITRILFTAVSIVNAGPLMAADNVPQILRSTHYEYRYDDGHERPAGHVSWQDIELTEESAQNLPLLADTLGSLSQSMSSDAMENLEYMVDLSESGENYFPDNGLEFEDTVEIRRNDGRVLSYLDYHSDYMGGAHGYYCYLGVNLDVQTGQHIDLNQVIADQNALRSVVKTKLLEKYPDIEELWSLDESLANYENGSGDGYRYEWVMEPDGISIFFNPYAIASYAAGMQNITISFSEYPNLFTGRYGPVEGSYFKDLMAYYPERVVLANGNVVNVSVGQDYDSYGGDYDYGYYDAYTVTIGETTLRHEAYFYSIHPQMIHMSDGRIYLYLQWNSDNDWKSTDIVDISNGIPIFVGNFNGFLGVDYNEEDWISYEVLFSDTEHFRMDTRLNLLSTYSGIRYYTVGEDGMPQPLQQEYYRQGSYSYPLVTTVELIGVAADNPGQPITIPAGSSLTIVKTDGESYVDLSMENGTMVRLTLEENTEGWGHKINGRDEFDCFEMLYYAG